jgi:hypothetical protein
MAASRGLLFVDGSASFVVVSGCIQYTYGGGIYQRRIDFFFAAAAYSTDGRILDEDKEGRPPVKGGNSAQDVFSPSSIIILCIVR